ncbi:MAG: hypothetical protein P1Q69_08995 [Candidatus Thorarchaeota archaeon]|nr:hypothetical protein [Candidatus Thorarchaeota archaeon]
MIEIIFEEQTFNETKRLPMMVAIKCPKKHNFIAFVDKEKRGRDIEVAAQKNEADAIDRSKNYFEAF